MLLPPYDALVFDLGNVIIPHDNAALHARIASRCAAPDAAERLAGIAFGPIYTTGIEPIAHLHARISRECGYALDWDGFVADWCSHLTLDRGMLDLVEALGCRRRVMIFSNTNREHWAHAVALSDGRLARIEAYLSHEIGQMKPSVDSFRAVAAMARIEPSRSLFVDDVAVNVEAAREAGFAGHVFTTQAAFEVFLGSGSTDPSGS